MNDTKQPVGPSITGAAIIDAIKRSGVGFVVSVPDRVTSETVLRGVAGDPALKLVRVCKEDEGVSICAALSFCNQRAVLLMHLPAGFRLHARPRRAREIPNGHRA